MADEKLNTGPAENISPEAAEPIATPEQAAASLWLSPYTEKVFIFVPRTYSCRDGQRAACQYGKEKQTAHRRFYPQKNPEA